MKKEGLLHLYPKGEVKLHTMTNAAGCWCEPMVKRIVIDDGGPVPTKVIVHQCIKGKQ